MGDFKRGIRKDQNETNKNGKIDELDGLDGLVMMDDAELSTSRWRNS
jgi:hypothetical protein